MNDPITAPVLTAEEMLRSPEIFPLLTPEELLSAEGCGRKERYKKGEMLFAAGERGIDFLWSSAAGWK